MDKKLQIKYMKEALKQAKKGASMGEIPVGAVVVLDGKIIGRGHNLRVKDSDATAHAEVVAIKKAGKKLGRWNLTGCEIFVTLEPCVMCAGAIVNARLKSVYFGAYDPRFGACGTLINLACWDKLNHRAEVFGGVMEGECADVLKEHFKAMREKNAGEK